MNPLLKSSHDWQVLLLPYILVLDADGWNRQDFDNSWNEKISLEEFKKRCEPSTCEYKKGTKAFYDIKESDLIYEELPHGDDKDL